MSARRIFDTTMVVVSWRWARSLEALLGTRRLQPQLLLAVCVTIAAAFWPLYARGFAPTFTITDIDAAFALLWAIGIVCSIGAAYQAKYHRLAALILMGGAGLVTCITFVWLSAPDLALTQLLVEVVTTVLILLGLRWLPQRRADVVSPGEETAAYEAVARTRRMRDLVIAIAAGTGLAIIAYAAMTQPPADGIARYFIEHAYTEGGGRNIVNVILVDFRAFDTFGEITVLGVVALTVFALLRRFRPAPDSIDRPEQQRGIQARKMDNPEREKSETIADYMMIPSVLMRLLFPVITVFAIYLFLRGHDLPGGGFVAGLAMAIAFIVQYMAGGAHWVEARLNIRPVIWIALGLLCAATTGMGAWLVGYPFLTSHSTYAHIPLIGTLPFASAVLFDLGVFMLVVGATVLMLIALARQSIRSHRTPHTPSAITTIMREH